MIDKRNLAFFIHMFAITLVALIVRWAGRDFIIDDMSRFLLPWFDTIKSAGGLPALKDQVGDYGLLYQTIIALLTNINAKPLYLYKIVSFFFDFLLAISVAFFVSNSESASNRKKYFCIYFAFIILFPTVVWNSAFWGQCDSIYTFFLLWAVWFLHKEKFSNAFFMLGCALAFKLQTVLIFPLFAYYYICRKRYSLFYILITVFTFWFSGILAYFYGRPVFDGIRIYFCQVTEYKHMWMNVPSFWVLFDNDYARFHVIAIGLAIVLLAIGLFVVSIAKLSMSTFEQVISFAVLIEWTCILFLPCMHDRYTYVLDLLLLMLSFINKKYIIYAFIAVAMSCLTYSAYLFLEYAIINPLLSITYLLAWIIYSYYLFTPKAQKIV